jgi:diguanylate cyclase (GGDEF)-like protein/PAS domain S-box-containing protein
METLLGYPPGAMLGRGIEDFMPPAEVEQAAELKLHREQGLREVNEFRLQRADGGALYTLMSTTPLFDAAGKFAGATAMVTDISQRMQVEAALAATAEFVSRPGGATYDADLVRHAARTLGLDYVHIARLHPDGLGVTTEAAWLDGRLIDNWSYELTNTPCVEVLLKSRRCITSGVRAAYPADADLRNVGAEGYVGEPIIDSGGQVLGLIVGISRAPIRSAAMIQSNLRILAARAGAEWEQHAAWSKLREERDFNRNILRNTEAIVVTLDTQGRITLINRKGCQLLGYDEAELLGQDWFATCLPPNTQIDQIREIFRKAMRDDLLGSEYYENPVLTRSGEQRLIAWHNSSLSDAHGNLVGGMSIGMDVTQQRQAEALLRASEERFHRLFDDADALAIQGYLPDGEVVFWNHASETIYGYSAAEAVGANLYDLIIPPAMRDEVRDNVRKIIESGQRIPPGRLWLKHKDGHPVLVYSSHTLVETPGQPKVLFCMDVDLNELAQVEAELNIALTKYKTLFDSFPLGITITDPNGHVLEVNAAAEDLLGLHQAVHLQRDIDSPEWRIVRVDGTPMPPEEFASVRALKEKRRIENVEMGVIKPDGEVSWLSVTADLLPLQGYGLVISYSDIGARRAAEEQIRQMAYYDPLTNLPNRRLLMDRLAQALIASKRSQAYGALLMLDLDNFKHLNDSYGHGVGDHLLIEVADRLRAHVRQEDSVARLGGDEYVVILEDLGGDLDVAINQSELLAEKIRQALSRPYLLAGVEKPYSCSASIGVRLFRSHLESVENVLKQADVALYQAKDAGRNKVVFHTPQ